LSFLKKLNSPIIIISIEKIISFLFILVGVFSSLRLTVPLQQQAGSSENESLVKVQKIIKEPND